MVKNFATSIRTNRKCSFDYFKKYTLYEYTKTHFIRSHNEVCTNFYIFFFFTDDLVVQPVQEETSAPLQNGPVIHSINAVYTYVFH